MLLEKVKDFSYSVQPYFSNDSNMAENIQIFLNELSSPLFQGPINMHFPPPFEMDILPPEYVSPTLPPLDMYVPPTLPPLDVYVPPSLENIISPLHLQMPPLDPNPSFAFHFDHLYGSSENLPNIEVPPPVFLGVPLLNPSSMNLEYELSDPEDLYLLDVDSMDEDSTSDSNSVSSIDAESIIDSSSNVSVDGESIIGSHSENDDVII